MPQVNGHGADVLAIVEAAYRRHFETTPARASTSFVGVDPIEVLRYSNDTRDHYVSLGMSRYPMANPSEVVVDASTAPRAELLLVAAGRPDEMWRSLAILAAGPAVEGAVYVFGDRVDFGDPLCSGSRCTGGLLVAGPLEPIAVPGGADVTVMQLIPATAIELAWARVHGSEALRQRWQQAKTQLTDLARAPVDLT